MLRIQWKKPISCLLSLVVDQGCDRNTSYRLTFSKIFAGEVWAYWQALPPVHSGRSICYFRGIILASVGLTEFCCWYSCIRGRTFTGISVCLEMSLGFFSPSLFWKLVYHHMHVYQFLTIFITNNNLLGVNMFSVVSHYYFPWKLHGGISNQGKTLLSTLRKYWQ